ncbi:LysR substrate-binding domain-containing protein [Pseudoroseomonas ludipueritiae]|uniref:LysR family transcriptional regulator n=1 Tax=Pseudoroseomonas ludipueritiae TaxID=198093 RepID=A0ABR7R3B6_9PROT|nr:LysR substrate-binding domain-containing protein [Pseudoroseomonas ludipueritiae]MBC9176211.1 LysR family transcriptional regulator [Pseudoroseomonas ludipueritiae]
MSYRRLPSLAALRSFEAAARHLSVTRAANELAITPGAVSRGVRQLEQELGTSLFLRGATGLTLTPAGETLLEAAGEAFDRLVAGVNSLRPTGARRLTLGVYALFASRWLIPRWHRLRERHPDLEIDLQTCADPAAMVPGRFDAAIAVTDGRPRPGLAMQRLVPIEMMPVCSPALAEGFDWRRVTLLHSRQRPEDWARWLSAAGIGGRDPHAGLFFESIALAIDAAAEGLGVALAIRSLAGADVATGRVAVPHPFLRPTTRAFTLLHEGSRQAEPELRALRDWLLEEAATPSWQH